MTPAAPELASRLAARICHDFAGPIGSVISGLDFLADPASPIPGEDALALARESARMLSAQLAFARAAFGAADKAFASDALEAVARALFEPIRPALTWAVAQPMLSGVEARILLNLVQLASGALATGGEVRATTRHGDGRCQLSADAIGPRARLHPEVQAGLDGRPRGEGLADRWVHGAFVHAIVTAAGGSVSADAYGQGVRFTAGLPV